MPDTFEKFTGRARKVFALAQEEAARFNHNYIGTEHLLLGLIREGGGIAARVLDNLGVSSSKARSAIEFIVGHGDGIIVGVPGLTPRAKKTIELAMDEARRLNDYAVGTEHLLLGLIREGGGIAAGVLESLGISLENIRQKVMHVVAHSSPYQQSISQANPFAPPLKRRSNPTDQPARHPSGEEMYAFAMRREDYRRLAAIAARMNRPVEEMIEEAVRRMWLDGEGDTDQPLPPAPTPQAD